MRFNPKRRTLNKTEALRYFRNLILPEVIAKFGRSDKVAISEAWNNFTDSLCKNREISPKQYESWSNPF